MGFNIYTSNDSGAPTMNGLTGSLLTVLNACLYTGYGSQPAAGWSKQFSDTASYGVLTQGSGSSSCSMFIFDAGTGSVSGQEAYLTGWDTVTSILGGNVTGSNQFPVQGQLNLRSGSVVVRKSAASSSVARPWVVYADSRTMYGFIKNGDRAGAHYCAFSFGDIYSVKSGSVDTGRCMIIGRNVASSSLLTDERMDVLSILNTTVTGHFIAHTYAGGSGSLGVGKHGDGIKGSATVLAGNVPYFNGPDSGIYISPVWVAESATSTIRGRMRGFYQICHNTSSLGDGQILSGSLDFPGKVFQVVTPSGNVGAYFIEISDTLETN